MSNSDQPDPSEETAESEETAVSEEIGASEEIEAFEEMGASDDSRVFNGAWRAVNETLLFYRHLKLLVYEVLSYEHMRS